jgi:hypothetical protein
MENTKVLKCVDCSWSASSTAYSQHKVDELAIEHYCTTHHTITSDQNAEYQLEP